MSRIWRLNFSSSSWIWGNFVHPCAVDTSRAVPSPNITFVTTTVADHKLPSGLRSSGMLRGVGWQQFTNVSGQPIGPLKMMPISCRETSVNKYQRTPLNMPGRRSPQLCRGERLKSHMSVALSITLTPPADVLHCFIVRSKSAAADTRHGRQIQSLCRHNVLTPKSRSSNLFMAKGHTGYCGLIRGQHVEK